MPDQAMPAILGTKLPKVSQKRPRKLNLKSNLNLLVQ